MKHKLIAPFAALFFCTGLIIASGSVSHGQTYRAHQSFAVSEYGTLLEVFDANGKSRFGKLANNGFELSYESKCKTASVSVVGKGKVVGLLPGRVKLDGHYATVTATTSDYALEITTYFALEAKTGRLIIRRKFRNLLSVPLTLKTLREFVDPSLVITGENENIGSQVYGQKIQSIDKLAKLFRSKVKGALPIGDCQTGECVDPPPPCPIPCGLMNFKARLTARLRPIDGRPEIKLEGLNRVAVASSRSAATLVMVQTPPLRADIGRRAKAQGPTLRSKVLVK